MLFWMLCLIERWRFSRFISVREQPLNTSISSDRTSASASIISSCNHKHASASEIVGLMNSGVNRRRIHLASVFGFQ
jgi:hypothetical protein